MFILIIKLWKHAEIKGTSPDNQELSKVLSLKPDLVNITDYMLCLLIRILPDFCLLGSFIFMFSNPLLTQSAMCHKQGIRLLSVI